MKYLIIGALIAFVILIIYARLRPYIELVRRVSGAMKGTLNANQAATQRAGSIRNQNKLVRCVSCGTWIPAERAVGPGPSLSDYCSRECLEKGATGNTGRIAG